MLKIIISVILLSSIECFELCGDWTAYKDTKCIKVLDKIGTEEEAVGNCSQLDKSSTLLTIHSKEEQEFLNNILNKYNTTSAFAWIGLKYTEKAYKWIDSSSLNFENWAKDAIKDGSEPCVQIYLSGINLDQWTDVSCKKTALIVCQKSQEFSLTLFKNIIEKQESKINSIETNFKNELKTGFDRQQTVIEKQQKEINSLIPIGFLYTQLPNTSAPTLLWPQFKWSDVTRDYSGLFFRAEGGEALPFGQIQQQNQSWISDIHLYGYQYDSWKHGDIYRLDLFTSLNQSKWIDIHGRGYDSSLGNLEFYTTSGEVRPKNTAVKIFKRIE